MSFRDFLKDIIFEYADRVVDSSDFADRLVSQVVANKFDRKEWPELSDGVDKDSQMEVDEIEDTTRETSTLFGAAPRALQPLWKENGRRHELHTSKSNSSATLLQVKAIRQKLNGACGYYSLFHSSMSIIARECSDDAFARLILRQMFNRSLFFVMMARWKVQLLANCLEFQKPEKRDSFAATHWKPELVRTGVVERLYMDHLLSTDSFIGAIKTWTGASYHALPEISLSQLKSRLSVVTLDTVDEISRQLAQDDRPHAFLIGQLNHWIAIVSNRVVRPTTSINSNVPQLSSAIHKAPSLLIQTEENDVYSVSELEPEGTLSNRFIETILLDSRNDFVLNMGPNEIAKRVDKRVKKEFKPTGSLWHDLCIKLYEQSLHDTQYSCDLFHALTVSIEGAKPRPTENTKSSIDASNDTSESTSKKRESRKRDNSSKKAATKVDTSEPHPITTELILLNVRGFFENFEKHVGDSIDVDCQKDNKEWVASLPTCDMFDWMFKFQLYVQEYAPLRSIEDGFIGSLKNVKKKGYKMPAEIPKALTRWSLLLEARILQARKADAIQGDAEAIVDDLLANTIPWIATSVKYLKRK